MPCPSAKLFPGALELGVGVGVGVVVADAIPATPSPAPTATAAAPRPSAIFVVRDICYLLDLPHGDGA
jgi:hypothetical protein